MPYRRYGDDATWPPEDGWADEAAVPFFHTGAPAPRTRFTPGVASSARVYNWLLGGKDNFAADREAGARLLEVMPEARLAARANRAFLRQAVRRLAAAGVRQFIDIGCGLPADENTHEVAQRAAPGSRVVYLDIDPMVVAQARALLATDDRTIAIRRTMCDPWRIVTDPVIRRHLNFSRPIGLLLLAVLHYLVRDAAACEVVRILRKMLPPGSFLVLSHLLEDGQPQTWLARAVYGEAVVPVTARTAERIAELLDGMEPVAHGVAHISIWLEGDESAGLGSVYDQAALRQIPLVCAIARMPA
ncbi:SAM-dependent methyltransferase [Thermopolyspora flexuosa]|uniref:S-adenosyl methyltransferase n=1 Tax=Thermopolyspora flexuosa TaxID=103836 RepID=A0A543ISY9_9ACTN|nr:S-adenosyl methyltransferase [Thermopolyspora flexuosa]GGM83418.1 SAM-dependent methyltransferase [Thermopolyspora flexuosa]